MSLKLSGLKLPYLYAIHSSGTATSVPSAVQQRSKPPTDPKTEEIFCLRENQGGPMSCYIRKAKKQTEQYFMFLLLCEKPLAMVK